MYPILFYANLDVKNLPQDFTYWLASNLEISTASQHSLDTTLRAWFCSPPLKLTDLSITPADQISLGTLSICPGLFETRHLVSRNRESMILMIALGFNQHGAHPLIMFSGPGWWQVHLEAQPSPQSDGLYGRHNKKGKAQGHFKASLHQPPKSRGRAKDEPVSGHSGS